MSDSTSCNKPTDAQIQSQIVNLRWQEKQTELSNAFNRQQIQASNSLQAARMQMEHEHYMVDHLATPVCAVLVVLAIISAVIVLSLKSIQVGIQKNQQDQDAQTIRNRDDNAADVQEARAILEKHEASVA